MLHEIGGGELFKGRAYGDSWPYFRKGDLVFAPGLPVVVGQTTVSGADGEYQRRAEGVWREGAGVETLFLEEEAATQGSPGRAIDLLWFENSARYLVRDGALEIEDLFAVLRVPVTPPLLSRVLIGRQKLPESVLDGVRWPSKALAPEIEVGRPSELSTTERWRDARLALERRADVRSVHHEGAEMVAETETGDTVVFALAEKEDGWQLERQAGVYVFTHLSLVRRGEALWLRGVLDATMDPMAPGMRERLAFDLRADLVALY
ncbi:MAG: hypothetical protein P8Y93_03140 [Acidobacteriota bacterium]